MFADGGRTYPLGATVHRGKGVNFSVFSKNCIAVELLLFDTVNASGPSQVLRLDPKTHREYHYWQLFVPGIAAGLETACV